MEADPAAPPPGFAPLRHRSAYGSMVGPVYQRKAGGETVLGFRVQEKHMNLGGVTHGGMIATFADIMLGQMDLRDYDRTTVTIRLQVDYVGAARLGDWVEGRVRFVRPEGDLFFTEGVITTRGRLLASVSAIFKVLARRPGGRRET